MLNYTLREILLSMYTWLYAYKTKYVVDLVILTSTVFGTQWTGNILKGQVIKEGLVLETKILVYIIYDF